MKKGRNNKKKSSAWERYGRKRPTFCFRNYEELNDRINKVKKAEGISNTNIVEAGVGLFEVKVAKEEEARNQGYEEGYDEGYEEARKIYGAPFPCSVCRKPVEVTDERTKEAIKGYLVRDRWGHAECIDRRY